MSASLLRGRTKSCGCLNGLHTGPKRVVAAKPTPTRAKRQKDNKSWELQVRRQSASFEQAIRKLAEAGTH